MNGVELGELRSLLERSREAAFPSLSFFSCIPLLPAFLIDASQSVASGVEQPFGHGHGTGNGNGYGYEDDSSSAH